MALKRKPEEVSSDAKKRKRVGFASIDSGVEPNECIKVFLVSSQDEVGTTNGFLIDPVDLNHFFGEDGKIYGYKDLKINIWLSSVSFHAYADISYERTLNGGKGITDLKPALQSIFGESLLEKKEFLQTFSTEKNNIRTIVSEGTIVSRDSSKEDDNTSDAHLDTEGSTTEVVRVDLHSMPVGLLYSRLLPLVLLLVEGSRPIDVTDPRWEIYFVVRKIKDKSGDYLSQLLGFATVYHFYHYPDSTRLRISQILVLPPHQGHGHGRCLLDAVNYVAVSENIYDVTVEEPSDYLQYLRTCVDTLRLLAFLPIKPAIGSIVSYLKEGKPTKRTCNLRYSPPESVVEIVRQKLKINKKQFLRCWEVLIYLNIDSEDPRLVDNFRSCVSERVKSDILDKDTEDNGKRLVEVRNDYDHDMTFVVFRAHASIESNGSDGKLEGDQKTQEEQLNQLVDKEMEDITEIAQKVSSLQKSLS